MNTSICPTCEKQNPINVETCQYCGSALNRNATEPLAPIHPGDMPVKTKTSDLESTLPGWLRDIRNATKKEAPASAPAEPPVAKPAPPKAAPLDLLAGLSQAGEDDDETPDWLKSLQSSLPTAAPEPAEPNQEQAQTPDWQLDSNPEPEPPAESEQNWGFGTQPITFNFDENAESAPQVADDTPDWLADLKAQDETARSGSAENTPAAQADFDPLAGQDMSDWLASLSETGTESIPQPESGSLGQTSAPDDNTPDWLSSLGTGIEAPNLEAPPENISAGSAPDWLSDLGGTFTPDETSASAISSIDTPDWLSNLGAEPVRNDAAPVENQPPAADLPDWISSLQDHAAPAPAQAEIEPEPASAAEVPDWMDSGQEQALTAEEPAAPIDGDLPSWLAEAIGEQPDEKAVRASKPFNTGALQELKPIIADSELPDWMANLGGPAEAPAAKQILPTAPAASLPVEAELPDWMNNLSAGAVAIETATEAEGQPEPVKPAKAESAPMEAPAPETEDPISFNVSGEEQNLDAILDMEVPDWLSGFTPPKVEQKNAPAEDQPDDADLRPAELPSWVQAMRPMEAVISDADEDGELDNFENQGPLAGLRNTLPGQTGLPEAHKPKVFSIKLLANETQLAQAALLENLLNSENTPQAVKKSTQTQVIRPLRLVIAAVLLLVVLIPAILGTRIFPAPQLSTDKSTISAFIETTNNIPAGAPVLLVVDYQPGFAGELEPAAGAVLAQLVDKQARLAFISTSPMGSYMAERLMQKVSSTYVAGTQYVNLGYLPGGAGGIKVFSDRPKTTVGQDTILGNLWDTPSMAGVNRLADFSALVVMTDNPDTGRLWIEQSEAALAGTPLLMLISAQAEPMLQPYLLSGQIKGLVAGLEGAALYESAAGKDGPARMNWDAFGAGLLATELLIIIGGVWGLMTSLRARRSAMEQDEA